MNFRFDLISFFLGMAVATLVWWAAIFLRPLFERLIESIRARRIDRGQKAGTELEDAYLKAVYKKTQGMHLASSLFALDEIIETPRLLAPPAIFEPINPHRHHQDIVEQTLPYLPRYPELGAFYNAKTLSLPEALSGGKQLAIIGQPGSGKSTALAYLAAQIAKNSPDVQELQGRIPFLIHIADLGLPLNNPQKPDDYLALITDHLSSLMGVFEGSRFSKFVRNAFVDGRALLLLDGIDELPQASIQEVTDYLRVLLRHYKDTRAVITGSPEYLDGTLSLEFTPLAIMPWSSAQYSHFLANWDELWQKYVAFEAWAQQDGTPVDALLLNRWLSSDNFGHTPLDYTLKIWGAFAGDITSTRSVSTIEAHIRRLTPTTTPIEALSILALQVTNNETPFFDPRRAREWTQSFETGETSHALPAEVQSEEFGDLSSETPESATDEKVELGKVSRQTTQQPKASLITTLINSGLLTWHDRNRLRFAHPTFLGYLTGKALAVYPSNSTLLLKQKAWAGQSNALRYMASTGDMTNVVRELMATTDHILMRPKLLAAQLLRDAKSTQTTDWRSMVMASLLQILQNTDNPIGLRAEAMLAVVLSGEPNASVLFRQLMLTSSPETHLLSALGAGMLRDIKSVESLVSLTANSNDPVRRAACLALVEIGTPKALEAVAVYLIRGDEQLRVYAAEALANHPEDGHEALREGITNEDILIRRAVVYGLSRIHEDWATSLLENIQINDEQWAVRNVAVEALQARQSPDPSIPRKLTPPHETPWLIEFAGKYGMGIGPGQPATDILLLAIKDSNRELFLPSLAYLQNTSNEGVLAALYPFLFGSDPEAREGVYQALSFMALGGISLPDPKQFGLG